MIEVSIAIWASHFAKVQLDLSADTCTQKYSMVSLIKPVHAQESLHHKYDQL